MLDGLVPAVLVLIVGLLFGGMPDIVTSNGVIHVIDTVIMPK
jgi:hypothetical protein